MIDKIHGEDEFNGLVPRSNRNVKVNLKSSLEGNYVDFKEQVSGSKRMAGDLDMFEVNSISQDSRLGMKIGSNMDSLNNLTIGKTTLLRNKEQ
jgi:hypothetical protein